LLGRAEICHNTDAIPPHPDKFRANIWDFFTGIWDTVSIKFVGVFRDIPDLTFAGLWILDFAYRILDFVLASSIYCKMLRDVKRTLNVDVHS